MVTGTNLSDDQRAQLVLVGSVAIAFIIISLVVVFNTVLFTNNLAARGSVEEVEDASTFQQQVEREVPELVRHVENGTDSNGALGGNVDDNVTVAYSELLAESYADTSPKYADVEFNASSTVDGTRVVHDDGGQFRNATSDTTWDPIDSDDPRNVSGFEAEINVSSDELLDLTGGLSGDNFTVVIESEGATGEDPVYIGFVSEGDTLIINQSRTGAIEQNLCVIDSTDYSGNHATVNITNGSSPDDPSCQFDSTNVLTGPYSIRFENGQNVAGNYTFLVNGTIDAAANSNYNGRNGADPYANHVILEAGVDLYFESRTVTYESNQTVTIREGPQ